MSDTRRLVVSIDDQTLTVMDGGTSRRVFPVSTSIKGMGFTKDSYRTPTGLFRICEKIGGGHARGTIFKARVPVGHWQMGDSPHADLVLTRILRLDGLESANANTLERCVYIHGTNREDLIGKPAGHGCVRLRNDDMIELFDMVAPNDPVEIQPATRPHGALLFIMLDRVLTPLDGMIELARCRGSETLRDVSNMRAAMRGGAVAPDDAWLRCMELIRPDRGICADAAARCIESLAAGAIKFLSDAKSHGWMPVVLSHSPAALAAPVVHALGVEHWEAPELMFDADASHMDSVRDCAMCGFFSMAGVIMDWRRALLPRRVVLIADRSATPDAKAAADGFVGFGCSSGSRDGTADDDSQMNGFSDRLAWSRVLHLPLNYP